MKCRFAPVECDATMPLRAPFALLLLFLSACRDEQAGPRRRPTVEALRTLPAVPSGLTYRAQITFGAGAVEYLGSRLLPAAPNPGQRVQARHYFRATRPPPQGYQFFVHLVDADSGAMVANLDHEPQGGRAPLVAWPVGNVIEDDHDFVMPEAGGPFRLVLGFWRGAERLPVDLESGHDGQQRALGPTLGLLPEYLVRRAAAPPRLDGALDDAAWTNAAPVELLGSFDGRATQVKTTARLAYDDTHLYVAFDAEDPDIYGTFRKNDEPLYTEEVVEVFLDANGDGRTYNELQVSPHNVQFDAAFEERRKDLETAKAWRSGLKSAVRVLGTLDNASDRDERWQVEMAIPFKGLNQVPTLPPKPNDVWRFNLYRLEHVGRRQVEGQAFSPLYVGDFHHLPRFARLRFQ